MKFIEIDIDIIPMGAVRVNAKGKQTPRAVAYHHWMDSFRWLWAQACIKAGIPGNSVLPGKIYSMEFGLPIPDPTIGTKKVIAEKLARIGQEHLKKPDIDNIYKAVVDSIFYKKIGKNDSAIWNITNGLSKVYTPFGSGYVRIKFYYND